MLQDIIFEVTSRDHSCVPLLYTSGEQEHIQPCTVLKSLNLDGLQNSGYGGR